MTNVPSQFFLCQSFSVPVVLQASLPFFYSPCFFCPSSFQKFLLGLIVGCQIAWTENLGSWSGVMGSKKLSSYCEVLIVRYWNCWTVPVVSEYVLSAECHWYCHPNFSPFANLVLIVHWCHWSCHMSCSIFSGMPVNVQMKWGNMLRLWVCWKAEVTIDTDAVEVMLKCRVRPSGYFFISSGSAIIATINITIKSRGMKFILSLDSCFETSFIHQNCMKTWWPHLLFSLLSFYSLPGKL